MQKSSPIPLSIFLFCFLLILVTGGWIKRNEILAELYFLRFQNAQTADVKCSNLLQILSVSPEKSLNSVIQQAYPQGQYNLKRSTLLGNKYAVVELRETTKWATLQKRLSDSSLQVVLFKKGSNGNFQVIYSCEKFLG
ncbi:hypothetical protein NIES4074_04270 [Cylindrospermum sp. NIES-4074]|nr:hypothetical protein NIES4074_04270 [Cylindrospermum sp. NIES-4074]